MSFHQDEFHQKKFNRINPASIDEGATPDQIWLYYFEWTIEDILKAFDHKVSYMNLPSSQQTKKGEKRFEQLWSAIQTALDKFPEAL